MHQCWWGTRNPRRPDDDHGNNQLGLVIVHFRFGVWQQIALCHDHHYSLIEGGVIDLTLNLNLDCTHDQVDRADVESLAGEP